MLSWACGGPTRWRRLPSSFSCCERAGMPGTARITMTTTEALPVPSSHHHSAAGASRRRLLIVLALVVGFLAVEVLGRLLTNSLALLADAGHMFTDAVGVGLALLAIHFAARPATASKSYGYYR